MDSELDWTWNDGWILIATYLAHESDGASLRELIAAADAINHAIPTAVELSNAFTKLASAGIVEVADDNRFQIRKDLLPEIEKAYKGKGGLFESGAKGEKWLRSVDMTPTTIGDDLITADEVSIAYREYIAASRKRQGSD